MVMQDILNNLSQNDVTRILDEWNIGAGEEGFLSVIVFVDSDNGAHRIFLENQETEAKAMLALVQDEKDLNEPMETYLQWVEEWQDSRGVLVLSEDEPSDEEEFDEVCDEDEDQEYEYF